MEAGCGTFPTDHHFQLAGKLIEGPGLMDAEEYRRKARYFLAIAHQLTRPEDRAAMVEMAALWMQRAEEAEQRERIVRQRETEVRQREKEPEGGGRS